MSKVKTKKSLLRVSTNHDRFIFGKDELNLLKYNPDGGLMFYFDGGSGRAYIAFEQDIDIHNYLPESKNSNLHIFHSSNLVEHFERVFPKHLATTADIVYFEISQYPDDRGRHELFPIFKGRGEDI